MTKPFISIALCVLAMEISSGEIRFRSLFGGGEILLHANQSVDVYVGTMGKLHVKQA